MPETCVRRTFLQFLASMNQIRKSPTEHFVSVRIPFLMDPFGVWFVPVGVIHVFFTMSWPLHVCGCVLIVLMWHELVSQTNLTVNTGFLTSTRYPAVIIITLACLVELVTACLRAIGLVGFIINLNACVPLLGVVFFFFYVFFAESFLSVQCALLHHSWRLLRRLLLRIRQGLRVCERSAQSWQERRSAETCVLSIFCERHYVTRPSYKRNFHDHEILCYGCFAVDNSLRRHRFSMRWINLHHSCLLGSTGFNEAL